MYRPSAFNTPTLDLHLFSYHFLSRLLSSLIYPSITRGNWALDPFAAWVSVFFPYVGYCVIHISYVMYLFLVFSWGFK